MPFPYEASVNNAQSEEYSETSAVVGTGRKEHYRVILRSGLRANESNVRSSRFNCRLQ